MSAFGYGHDPDGTAAPGNAVVAAAAGLLPLHAITKLATTSRVAPTAVRFVKSAFI